MAIQSFHLCSITTHRFWLHPALSFSSTKKCFPSVCVKPSWTALVRASSPAFKPISLITASPKHQRKVLEEMLQSAIRSKADRVQDSSENGGTDHCLENISSGSLPARKDLTPSARPTTENENPFPF